MGVLDAESPFKSLAVTAAAEASTAAASVLGAHLLRVVSKGKYIEAVEPFLERLVDAAVEAVAEQRATDPLAFLVEFLGSVLEARSSAPQGPRSPVPVGTPAYQKSMKHLAARVDLEVSELAAATQCSLTADLKRDDLKQADIDALGHVLEAGGLPKLLHFRCLGRVSDPKLVPRLVAVCRAHRTPTTPLAVSGLDPAATEADLTQSRLQGCDARLQAAQLAGTLARKIGQASGVDGGAQKSLATTLSNVLSGAQLNSDAPLPSSRRRGLAEASEASDGGNANATALVDTVDASLGALSASLVRGAVAGEGYTLDTPNLALRAARSSGGLAQSAHFAA